MRVKFSPAYIKGVESIIRVVGENKILIDDDEFDFDIDSVIFPDVFDITGGKIIEAKRVDGILHLEVLRKYGTIKQPEWDTGDYHVIEG